MIERGRDAADAGRALSTAEPHVLTGELPAGIPAVRPGVAVTPGAVLALQRAAGNAAVVGLLREAGHTVAVDRDGRDTGLGRESPERTTVQCTSVDQVLRSAGSPLDAATRTDMEARMGADFTDVRVHSDAAARASAADLGARAYTAGEHVVLGDGLRISDPSDREAEQRQAIKAYLEDAANNIGEVFAQRSNADAEMEKLDKLNELTEKSKT